MADDFEDILNANNDGLQAEYLILTGAEGIEILVSVPHFSDHFITIETITEIVEILGGTNALLLYFAIISIVAVVYLAPIWFVQRKDK